MVEGNCGLGLLLAKRVALLWSQRSARRHASPLVGLGLSRELVDGQQLARCQGGNGDDSRLIVTLVNKSVVGRLLSAKSSLRLLLLLLNPARTLRRQALADQLLGHDPVLADRSLPAHPRFCVDVDVSVKARRRRKLGRKSPHLLIVGGWRHNDGRNFQWLWSLGDSS